MSRNIVRIERINNFEYSFARSSEKGMKAVAKALTFKNPSGFAQRDKIEHFDKRNLTFRVGFMTTKPTAAVLYADELVKALEEDSPTDEIKPNKEIEKLFKKA